MLCLLLLPPLLLSVAPLAAAGVGGPSYITALDCVGCFPLLAEGASAAIFVEETDWPGVARAARDLQQDIGRVSALAPPSMPASVDQLPAIVILVGTVGRSPAIAALAAAGKIDTAAIVGKWESFFVQVVEDPFPHVTKALVICGSDKRGSIYGVYEVAEQIGVSPWYWWADVTPATQESLFVKPGTYQEGPPSVQYR